MKDTDIASIVIETAGRKAVRHSISNHEPTKLTLHLRDEHLVFKALTVTLTVDTINMATNEPGLLLEVFDEAGTLVLTEEVTPFHELTDEELEERKATR